MLAALLLEQGAVVEPVGYESRFTAAFITSDNKGFILDLHLVLFRLWLLSVLARCKFCPFLTTSAELI